VWMLCYNDRNTRVRVKQIVRTHMTMVGFVLSIIEPSMTCGPLWSPGEAAMSAPCQDNAS
jgi:hypothetical protein